MAMPLRLDLPMNTPPLVAKIVRNAVVIDDHMFFKCEFHGACENPYKPKDPRCEECQTIVFFIRDVMANERRDEPGNLETFERAVANACQAQDEGRFDFRAFRRPKIEWTDEDVDDPASRVILTDV